MRTTSRGSTYYEELDDTALSNLRSPSKRNKKEIREWMDIDWDVTRARLKMIRDKYPNISKKMIIGVKHKIQRPTKEHYTPIVNELQTLTLGKVKKKSDWLESRVEWNGLRTDDVEFPISENQFVDCRELAKRRTSAI